MECREGDDVQDDSISLFGTDTDVLPYVSLCCWKDNMKEKNPRNMRDKVKTSREN